MATWVNLIVPHIMNIDKANLFHSKIFESFLDNVTQCWQARYHDCDIILEECGLARTYIQRKEQMHSSMFALHECKSKRVRRRKG